MKREHILLALSIVMGGGCYQDALTDHSSVMPEARLKPTKPPIGRAEVLPPSTWDSPEGMAKLRTSVCDQQYVLQIKRISSHQGNVVLRVNSKDGDDYGWSSVMTQIPFHTLADTGFSTILLFDEDDVEICFLSTDNVAFVQGLFFDEDVELEARFYNVSSMINTTAENILWPEPDRVYYTMYPAVSGDCDNQMPTYCCDYTFEADLHSPSLQEGTMQFGFLWDGGGGVYSFNVPPPGGNSHESTYCGPVIIRWWAENHVTTNGEGFLEFDCDNTRYNFIIGDVNEVHGVLIDPDGRMCNLTY